MRTCAVIPAFNEENTVGEVVEGAAGFVDSTVVVDDGSKDRTAAVAEGAGAVVLAHRVNLGKGSALKTGTLWAVEQGFEAVVFIDADGQHDPAEIPLLLKALEEGAEVVFGARKFDQEMPLLFRLGNTFLNFAVRVLYGIRTSDSQTGFKAFRTRVFPRIWWASSDYSADTEILVKVAKNKISYREVEVKTLYRDTYKGTDFFDGLKIFLEMVLWRI